MRFEKSLLFLIMLSFVLACGNNGQEQTEQQQAWDAVMAVHDEVMPKMADVNRLTTQLRAKAAALDSNQTTTKDVYYNAVQSLERKEVYFSAIQSLERADEGMMTWMAAVRAPEVLRGERKSHAEIMQYLKEEQNKVNQVRDSILTSLERGNQVLHQVSDAPVDTTDRQ